MRDGDTMTGIIVLGSGLAAWAIGAVIAFTLFSWYDAIKGEESDYEGNLNMALGWPVLLAATIVIWPFVAVGRALSDAATNAGKRKRERREAYEAELRDTEAEVKRILGE